MTSCTAPMIRWFATLLAALVVGGCAGQPAAGRSPGGRAPGAETVVILVRHAEKADASADPPLSAAGRARAELLARSLRDAGVDTVYYSDRKRTKETAEVAMAGWETRPGTIREYAATSKAEDLARMLREEKPGSTILCVSHSNVIAPLLLSLGGWEQPPLSEAEFEWMFIIRLRAGGGGSLVRAGYPPR